MPLIPDSAEQLRPVDRLTINGVQRDAEADGFYRDLEHSLDDHDPALLDHIAAESGRLEGTSRDEIMRFGLRLTEMFRRTAEVSQMPPLVVIEDIDG